MSTSEFCIITYVNFGRYQLDVGCAMLMHGGARLLDEHVIRLDPRSISDDDFEADATSKFFDMAGSLSIRISAT